MLINELTLVFCIVGVGFVLWARRKVKQLDARLDQIERRMWLKRLSRLRAFAEQISDEQMRDDWLAKIEQVEGGKHER